MEEKTFFEKGDKVILEDDKKATILERKKEPITLNTIYLVDRKFVGKYDEEYGYNREYYGKGTWFVYPSEILKGEE